MTRRLSKTGLLVGVAATLFINTCVPLGVYAQNSGQKMLEDYLAETSYEIYAHSYIPAQYGLVELPDRALTASEYKEYDHFAEIEAAYRKAVEDYAAKGLILDICLEDFQQKYEQNDEDFSDYILELAVDNNMSDLNAGISTMSSGGNPSTYYNDTGTSMPSQCKYTKYYLLSKVKKGDIMYESQGDFWILGHAAIVEGLFYDSKQRRYYIRTIEAIRKGVVRSVIDDTRVDDGIGYIKRVNGDNQELVNNAVEFAKKQLGKAYAIDVPSKDYSQYEQDWYCSELVWAAYYNEGRGVNLENAGAADEPGITPRDLINSNTSYSINFRYK